MKRHVLIATALAVTLVVGLAGPAFAHSRHDHDRHSEKRHSHHKHHGHGHGHGHDHDGEAPGTVTVVADNLNNPRQVTVNDGAVYVAEAGTAGDTCIGEGEEQVCLGFTGSVTRVRHGEAERVQTGLFSIGGPEGDVVGLDAVAFKHDRMYGIMTGTCDVPPDIPTEVTDQLGKVLRLHGGTDFESVADVSAFECANNPDGQEIDTNPYGIAVKGRSIYVADAGGNSILKVNKWTGEVSLAAVISSSTHLQPVPTSLAIGPDGNLYIGSLDFETGPNGAIVYKLDLDTGELSEYATGLTFITGLNFGRNGDLYVSEFSTGFGDMGPLPDGQIVKIPWGAPAEGREVIGAGSLHFPTGVAYYKGALYVSNWGIATGEDGPFGPGAHGQLVRIEL
jgi:glucose/arabinose dehydrogenase